MEKDREPLPKDLLAKFLEAPLWTVMKLPASMLSPTTTDDWTSSHTEGPLWVYHLHKKEKDGSIRTEIWIADGNHRYFDILREHRLQAHLNGSEFKLEEIEVEVMKVKPHKDNDIRFMWNAKDYFE